jgi:sporulation protein YlmC with PRC-barrel domain
MRWYLVLFLCLLLVMTPACVRISAAPAPIVPIPNEIATETLVNYTVVSRDGTMIGPVDGVVISTETGNTEYVIVFIEDIYNFGKGAIHGPQDHYLPIPWSHLTLDATHQQLVVDAAAEFIKDAPVLTDLPDTSVAGWDADAAAYWTR